MRKKRNLAKKQKRSDISLRRRLKIYYQRFTYTIKILFIIILCLFLFTDLFKEFKDQIKNSFYKKSAEYGLVVQNVIIEGEKNISYEDIIKIINTEANTPILSLNIQELKDRLENHSWVKSAIIERQLPSTIYIAITERTPIAIWQFQQKIYLIDKDGNRIAKYENRNFEDLIHVVGQDANIYAQSLINSLDNHKELKTRIQSAVRYGQRRWDLNLDQQITIKMPDKDFNNAYDYLHNLDINNKLFGQKYKMLDLRDANKYYLEKY